MFEDVCSTRFHQPGCFPTKVQASAALLHKLEAAQRGKVGISRFRGGTRNAEPEDEDNKRLV